MLAISNVHTGCICPTGRRFPNPVLNHANYSDISGNNLFVWSHLILATTVRAFQALHYQVL